MPDDAIARPVAAERGLLRFLTCGSVDDGKSTLIGRLLFNAELVLAVNKLDLVGYDRAIFERIAESYAGVAAGLGFASLAMIPISARQGDNITAPSPNMPWYEGPSLLEYLESIDVEDTTAARPFRFPVQWINRPDLDFRGFAGTVAAGSVMPGDPVVVMGSGRQSRVKEIVTFDGRLPLATAGDAVTLTLEDEIDISRGDLLAAPQARAEFADQFAATLVWMKEESLIPGRSYWLKLGTRTVAATVTTIKHRIDVDTGAHLAAHTLGSNEIGFCNISTATPVAFDPYDANRETGGFILIAGFTQETAAAGMIAFALRRASNIHWQDSTVTPGQRAQLKGHQTAGLWFTG